MFSNEVRDQGETNDQHCTAPNSKQDNGDVYVVTTDVEVGLGIVCRIHNPDPDPEHCTQTKLVHN